MVNKESPASQKALIRRQLHARLIRIYRRGLLKRMTAAESCFEQILKKLKLNYMAQAGFFTPRSFCIVDFYIKAPVKLVVEINGEDHHQKSRLKRDIKKLRSLRRQGYAVAVFSNEQVIARPDEVEQRLCRILKAATP